MDAIHLPSHLNLPLFFFHVDRIRINKTRAKESKTFRGVAALVAYGESRWKAGVL